jgi:hypothetical protein
MLRTLKMELESQSQPLLWRQKGIPAQIAMLPVLQIVLLSPEANVNPVRLPGARSEMIAYEQVYIFARVHSA